MSTTLLPLAAGLLMASVGSALAAVRYVDVNSANPTPPPAASCVHFRTAWFKLRA